MVDTTYENQHDTPTTGAAAGNMFRVDKVPTTVSLVGSSLGDVEADLERQDSSDNWQEAYKDGNKITLSATRTFEAIWAPGEYRLNYTTRTNSVGGCHRAGGVG